jgi:hypothetical protein
MSFIKLLVAVDPNRDTHRIATDLRLAGLEVTSEYPLFGIIAGSAEERALTMLRRVGGVLSVEPDSELRPAWQPRLVP